MSLTRNQIQFTMVVGGNAENMGIRSQIYQIVINPKSEADDFLSQKGQSPYLNYVLL